MKRHRTSIKNFSKNFAVGIEVELHISQKHNVFVLKIIFNGINHLLCKSMVWFLYDNGPRHERVKRGLLN